MANGSSTLRGSSYRGIYAVITYSVRAILRRIATCICTHWPLELRDGVRTDARDRRTPHVAVRRGRIS